MSAVPSSLQYLRSLSVIVADSTGKGLELSDFRVRFEIRRGDTQTPNSCDCRVYNLSDQTAATIRNEFTQIAIQAGYGGNLNLIFRGVITQTRKGRIDQRDSYVDITAADGDEAYNFSSIAMSLARGHKPADKVQALLASMVSPSGLGSIPSPPPTVAQITAGYVTPLPTNGAVRGRVIFGMTVDEFEDFAAAYDLKWSIQDGQLTIIKNGYYIPGEAVLITPSTGLIGVPELTEHGLFMRVLLNPQVKIGQLVKLDSSDINQFRYGLDNQIQGQNLALAQQAGKLSADGLWYVMRADHIGDTRGDEWYTEITTLAVSADSPNNVTYTPSSSAPPVAQF